MLGKIAKVTTALIVTSIGLLYGPSATAANTQVGTPTDYAMSASGYATLLSGGGVPAGQARRRSRSSAAPTWPGSASGITRRASRSRAWPP